MSTMISNINIDVDDEDPTIMVNVRDPKRYPIKIETLIDLEAGQCGWNQVARALRIAHAFNITVTTSNKELLFSYLIDQNVGSREEIERIQEIPC